MNVLNVNRFYTHASNSGATTQHMAEKVMMQVHSSSCLLLSSLEFSDIQVYEP